jgi:hypothetical protein
MYLRRELASEKLKMGILSKERENTARRFIQVAIYGIIASESVMLRNWQTIAKPSILKENRREI